jgi:hypothetical protein
MNKAHRSSPLLWAGVAFAALLVAAGLMVYLRLPELSQLVPPGSTGIVVNIQSPMNGEAIDPAGITTVEAEALGGRPLTSLQLWIDGVLSGASQPAGGPSEHLSTYWAWTPSPGQHILVVSATDEQGRQGTSDPVVVFAADPSGGGLRTYAALPGETLGEIAGKLGVPPEALAASNPDLDPYAALPGGAPVDVPAPGPAAPVSFPPGPTGSGEGGPAPAAPGKLSAWLSLRGASASAPPAPALAAAADGCDVKLTITPSGPGAVGIFVYRFDGGSASFHRIAALGPGDPGSPFVYVDPAAYGPRMYYAAAFNAAGESDSAPAGVTVSDPDCEPADPVAARLSGLILTPTETLDRAYCYLSIDGGAWTRLPTGDGTFVYPLDGVFDFSPFVGPLPASGVTLRTQCWGWRGGTLVELGEAGGPRLNPGGMLALHGPAFEIGGLLDISDPFGGVWETRDPSGGTGPIMAPFNLGSTASLAECISHFPGGASGFLGPLLCGPAITHGNLILVWDWVPTCVFPVEGSKYACSDYLTEIDGFHIYAALPGKAAALAATVHSRDQRVYMFDGGRFSPGTRFSVRAYALALESPDSNSFVLGGTTPGTETVVLRPVLLLTSEQFAFDDDCDVDESPGLGSAAAFSDGVNMVVGQDYRYPASCVNWVDHRFFGRVSFDLAPVAGPVASASLSFKQGFSVSSQYLTIVPCLDQLGAVTSLAGSAPSGWDPFRKLPTTGISGTSHSVDATGLVRDWQLGDPNLGFVLTPSIDATRGDPYTQECWTTLSDFSLSVTFFK